MMVHLTEEEAGYYVRDFLQDDDVLNMHKAEISLAFIHGYPQLLACINKMEEIYNGSATPDELREQKRKYDGTSTNP